jgi:glutamate 5-kinase
MALHRPAFGKIVVKLGSSTLTGGAAELSPLRLWDLVRQIVAVQKAGSEVVLVSSGAVAAGRAQLAFRPLPKSVPGKQMLAAVGQPKLMALYGQLFGLCGVTVAQVLLSRGDFADRRRYLNSRNTLLGLLTEGVVPIVNENDTVATEEIRVGDNDNLSALVANLVDADLLVLATDQEGLYDADPRGNPMARLIPEIAGETIPDEVWRAAGGGSSSGLGTGGMVTKLQAADLARRSGTAVVIAHGEAPDLLVALARGEARGTLFQPAGSKVESRKRYILAGGRVAGRVLLDAGAVQALRAGRSLLAVGVVGVDGEFHRGETVQLVGPGGAEVARGLTNYTAAELARIHGRRSEQIEAVLGYQFGDEVIHRNDLVLF